MGKDYLSRKLAVVLNADMIGAIIRHYPIKTENGFGLDLIETAPFQDMPKPIGN